MTVPPAPAVTESVKRGVGGSGSTTRRPSEVQDKMIKKDDKVYIYLFIYKLFLFKFS